MRPPAPIFKPRLLRWTAIMPSKPRFWSVPFAPLRYLIAWLIYLSMRGIVLLPFAWQLALGERMGALAGRLAPGRRRIVDRNLEVCFPDLPKADRDAIAAEHFKALGASVVETAMGWFGEEREIRRRVRIDGLEHLEAALARGRGVILFSGHFTSFELLFPALRPSCPRLCGMYKLQRNPVMNRMMNAGRRRNFDRLFAKDSVKDMLHELERNAVVWYASDQYFAGKSSALIPFFGTPAMTNTSISRIARISGAAVLSYACRRLPDATYVASIDRPPPGFPSGDVVEDTRLLTAQLEDIIRRCPAQYWWIHQRFKGRPEPYPDIYRPVRES
jgi:KDO2-lipid IV(A) lauroyltransferase